MELNDDVIAKEKIKFEKFKSSLSQKLGFEGINDDEIEDALRQLIVIESEVFDNSMNDLVLRKFYIYFLTYIYPQISFMLGVNKNGSSSLDLRLLELKKKINASINEGIKYVLNTYCYQIDGDYLVSSMNSHEVLLSEEIKALMNCPDIFMVEHNYDPKIATYYPSVDFNYEPAYWQLYADFLGRKIALLGENINEKIPNFEEEIEIYEEHIRLYKEYIRRYRFITAAEEFKGKAK